MLWKDLLLILYKVQKFPLGLQNQKDQKELRVFLFFRQPSSVLLMLSLYPRPTNRSEYTALEAIDILCSVSNKNKTIEKII